MVLQRFFLVNYYFVKLYLLIPKDRTGPVELKRPYYFKKGKKCLLTKIAQVEMKLVSLSLIAQTNLGKNMSESLLDFLNVLPEGPYQTTFSIYIAYCSNYG